MACGGGPVVFTRESFSIRIRCSVLWRYLSSSGYILKKFINVVKVWNQFQPERNLGSSVVVSDSRFEANVKVELVLGVVLCPRYLLEAVRLCVDEFGILWNWLVWIPEREKQIKPFSINMPRISGQLIITTLLYF